MLCHVANQPEPVWYSKEGYSALKPTPNVPPTLLKEYEIHGPEFQTADYKVNAETKDERPHPGPGYQVCALFQAGMCNRFSAFPDMLRRGDPMGEWGLHGLCEECWLRRREMKKRGLPDFGCENTPLRAEIENDLPRLMPIVPSFDREPVKSIVFFGDMFTPRISEQRGQRVSLTKFNEIQYTHQVAQDKDGNWRCVNERTRVERQRALTAANSGSLAATSTTTPDEVLKQQPKPLPPSTAEFIEIYDESNFLLSGQDLAASVFEHYQRDVTGKCKPGILTLVHNLDPDCVVISAGHLDLTEGVSAKDVFVATKILGEQALKVPRKHESLPARKVVFMAIPITPTLKQFPDMIKRRHLVLERLTHIQRMNPQVRVLQCFEGKTVSGGHFLQPASMLTKAEHAHALSVILNNLKTSPGDPVNDVLYPDVLHEFLVQGGPVVETKSSGATTGDATTSTNAASKINTQDEPPADQAATGGAAGESESAPVEVEVAADGEISNKPEVPGDGQDEDSGNIQTGDGAAVPGEDEQPKNTGEDAAAAAEGSLEGGDAAITTAEAAA
ncbi:unnamed protein product [Amoebophrya sp. A120]|nr:unnamed protein product [Amoebophrya sp. A120]|eukprot:GSA120T00019064001.1